jgi:hypothetical protein
MENHEYVVSILSKLNLDNIEQTILEPYKQSELGRPYENPWENSRRELDATFIKAWSKRDPFDDSHGYSDPESRVGRDGKGRACSQS